MQMASRRSRLTWSKSCAQHGRFRLTERVEGQSKVHPLFVSLPVTRSGFSHHTSYASTYFVMKRPANGAQKKYEPKYALCLRESWLRCHEKFGRAIGAMSTAIYQDVRMMRNIQRNARSCFVMPKIVWKCEFKTSRSFTRMMKFSPTERMGKAYTVGKPPLGCTNASAPGLLDWPEDTHM